MRASITFSSADAGGASSTRSTSSRFIVAILLFDQLDTAVLRAPVLRGVRRDADERRDAVRRKLRCRRFVLVDERLHHGVRATLGEVEVRREGTDVVGVADDVELQLRVLLEELPDLYEHRLRLRLHRG